MFASCAGYTEIVKIILEQNGNETNAKDVYLI